MASLAQSRVRVGNATLTSDNRTTICEGEYMVSDDPGAILTAVLGSCIAACLYDATLRIGGMNHFLLANPNSTSSRDAAALHRYGVHAMETLMNALLTRGASRATLRAHLYGGASMHDGMRPIGLENSTFAKEFLTREGIMLVHADIGGRLARRVEFRPADGLARSRSVQGEPVPPKKIHGHQIVEADAGDVELF